MKILFLCKHNRFRSKVAEAIFNKLNNNKNINASSAGLILDELRPYVSLNVVNLLNKRGYSVLGFPCQITSKKINNHDLLVIVADNVDKRFFSDSFKGKIIQWKIKDCSEDDILGIDKRISEIEKKVETLIQGVKA